MSAWAVFVKALHAHGGGPIISTLIDGDLASNNQRSYATRRAHALGLIYPASWRGHVARWALTALGWDWCEGRVALKIKNYHGQGRQAGIVVVPVATWLRALPRPGEVSLSGPQ